MKSNWKKVRLVDYVDILVGFTFQSKFFSNSNGIKLVRGDNVSLGYLNWDNTKYWPTYNKDLEKYLLKEHDVLIGMDGSRVGKNKAIIQKNDLPLLLVQRVACLRSKKSLLQKYLFFIIFSKQFTNYVDAIKTGSAIPHISSKQIADYQFYYPTLEDQRAISQLLQNFKDKIELNQRMNLTLEQIGQLLFKHWFVDFEFLNDEGKPYKSSGGKMVDSELGEIPKTWRISKLSEFGEIICGKTPSKSIKRYFNGSVPFIKIPDMRNNFYVTKTEDSLTKEGEKSQENKTIPSNSICVSCIATVGLVSLTSRPCQTNQQINSIVPYKINSTNYLFYLLKSMEKYFISLASGGTATLNMNTGDFSNILVLKPEDKILAMFQKMTLPLHEKILANMYEIDILTQLRDSLLPKLMSGEIRVSIPEGEES